MEGDSDGKGRGRRDNSDARRRRSRSREGMSDSERKRRFRYRESTRDFQTESMRDYSKRKRRSESWDSKTEQNFDRKARSRSREGVRDRDVDDRDRRRRVGTSDDAHRSRGRWKDVDGGRHERDEEIHERSHRGRREHIRGTSVERRKRSHSRESRRVRRGRSRESLRERERPGGSRETERSAGSRQGRGYGDDYPDRNSRYVKEYHDGQESRGNSMHDASRYGDREWERSREGGHGNHHNNRDRGDRSCQNRHSRGKASHIMRGKRRDEDRVEYQERIKSQLAAQKEVDVERIKEESTQRRQAILEKGKQQQKEEQQPEVQQAEVKMEKVVRVDLEVKVEENPKPMNDNMEVHGAEHTFNGMEFCLEKNIVNGESQNESVVGAGGLKQGSPKGELVREMAARADDVGLSDQSRALSFKPPLEWIQTKHKIFLSHSGCQKPFTEHLCEKLEAVQHYPFFDRRPDSLPKGVKFYDLIVTAAKECQVAILVLSEEFFIKSKWPMMELAMFVNAQEDNKRLKILPLFFKITREEFEKKKNGEEWMAAWQTFQKDDNRIDLSKWKKAISQVSGNNGIEYAGDIEGEAEFVKKVVKVVCNMPGLKPDVKWDVSHVQSKEALCEVYMNDSFCLGPY